MNKHDASEEAYTVHQDLHMPIAHRPEVSETILAPYGFGHSAYGEYSVVYSVFWAKIGRF